MSPRRAAAAGDAGDAARCGSSPAHKCTPGMLGDRSPARPGAEAPQPSPRHPTAFAHLWIRHGASQLAGVARVLLTARDGQPPSLSRGLRSEASSEEFCEELESPACSRGLFPLRSSNDHGRSQFSKLGSKPPSPVPSSLEAWGWRSLLGAGNGEFPAKPYSSGRWQGRNDGEWGKIKKDNYKKKNTEAFCGQGPVTTKSPT